MAIVLGPNLTIPQFVDIARKRVPIEFSTSYCERVQKSRQLVEKWTAEECVIYGVTTGFGALSTTVISSEQVRQLQKNILLSHAVSVGSPLDCEQVRAIMLMVLQNIGYGASGVRLQVLEYYKSLLNHHITPWAPGDGSVGYLSVEAHIALNLLGLGKSYLADNSQLVIGAEALKVLKLPPLELEAKEGLALISGTTSVTAFAALALYDMRQLALTADCIGAMNLEVSEGNLRAFSDPIMSVRPHVHQNQTATNVRNILQDSSIVGKGKEKRLQDALSLRCIPQLHGAVKKTISDAWAVVEIEMNSCCDNPVIYTEDGLEDAISGCNCDSSYVGLEMDSLAASAVLLGKMSERRTNRLLDPSLSEKSAFLVKNPGVNSGLMITQYTQAGLLNEMRGLAYPATVDNVPTCANQEDYVAMGYTAAKRMKDMVDKLEFIFAFELLAVYQCYYHLNRIEEMSTATKNIFSFIKEQIPELTEDVYLYPYVACLKEEIHKGTILNLVKDSGVDINFDC